MVGEGGLGPGLHDDLEGLLEVGSVAFLILDGGAVPPAPELRLTWLIATADAELQAPTADHVEHRRLLRDADGVPPGEDIGHLAEADALRLCSDRRLGQQRVGAELWPLRHEVVLGHKPVIEAEPLRQDSLPYLADEHPLIA